jgi:hypothetical protein
MLKHYHFTLIDASFRTERNIIAHSAIQAALIAARMLPEPQGSFAIICKPANQERIAA